MNEREERVIKLSIKQTMIAQIVRQKISGRSRLVWLERISGVGERVIWEVGNGLSDGQF